MTDKHTRWYSEITKLVGVNVLFWGTLIGAFWWSHSLGYFVLGVGVGLLLAEVRAAKAKATDRPTSRARERPLRGPFFLRSLTADRPVILFRG